MRQTMKHTKYLFKLLMDKKIFTILGSFLFGISGPSLDILIIILRYGYPFVMHFEVWKIQVLVC